MVWEDDNDMEGNGRELDWGGQLAGSDAWKDRQPGMVRSISTPPKHGPRTPETERKRRDREELLRDWYPRESRSFFVRKRNIHVYTRYPFWLKLWALSLWFKSVDSMDFLCISMDFLWTSKGFLWTSIDFLWTSSEFSWISGDGGRRGHPSPSLSPSLLRWR